MFQWSADSVAVITKGYLIGNPNIKVHGCVIDSRQARGGEMFFALKGEQVDGHDFLESAWKNGAALVIAEEACLKEKGVIPDVPQGKALLLVKSVLSSLHELARAWRVELGAKVVGVTGSNGKTTTKDMISTVLSGRYRVYWTQGNHNNELGLPITILNSPPDTEILVLEMGMRGLGEINSLCNIAKPNIGVITNIGTTHLELLKTQERIAEAKWELIEGLPEDGLAIINAEDEFSVRKAKSDSHNICYYGINPTYTQPNIVATQLQPWGDLGTTFEVSFQGEKAMVKLPLPGKHNVLDALAAIAVGVSLGVPMSEGCLQLVDLELSKMRLEFRRGFRGSILISDVYNANPVSMQASLGVLKERAVGKKTLAILGEMYELGTSSETGHREVGQCLAKLGISHLIAVGKLAQEIARGACLGGYSQDQIDVTASCEEAIVKARDYLTQSELGAWVLIKGSRGMKMEVITLQLESSE